MRARFDLPSLPVEDFGLPAAVDPEGLFPAFLEAASAASLALTIHRPRLRSAVPAGKTPNPMPQPQVPSQKKPRDKK